MSAPEVAAALCDLIDESGGAPLVIGGVGREELDGVPGTLILSLGVPPASAERPQWPRGYMSVFSHASAGGVTRYTQTIEPDPRQGPWPMCTVLARVPGRPPVSGVGTTPTDAWAALPSHFSTLRRVVCPADPSRPNVGDLLFGLEAPAVEEALSELRLAASVGAENIS